MDLKNIKKGDSVILCGFTGIKLGVFEVAKATDKTVTLEKSDGSQLIFSKKSGKQTNVEEGKERYANRIIADDGSFVPPRKKSGKKPSKKANNKLEVEELEDDYEDLDEEDE